MDLNGKYDTSNVAWDQPKGEVLGVLAVIYLSTHGYALPADASDYDEAAYHAAWNWARRRYEVENAP